MNRFAWLLLLITLISNTADAQYTQAQISNIVKRLAMRFSNFPRKGERQYGVLMVLPADHNVVLDPNETEVMRKPYQYNADNALGTNYAVSRTRFGQHTETQLLSHLQTLLYNYTVKFGVEPPAVLLYTRGTPCPDCTVIIANKRQELYPDRSRQFIVAYSTNMVSGYMTRSINCENRNYLRDNYDVEVYCVPESNSKQCREDDTKPCGQHEEL